MNNTNFKTRNPLLVIVWSFSLFILMHTWRYLGTWFASLMSGVNFDTIISGKFEDPSTIFIMGLTGIIFGIPLVFLLTKYLWRRDFSWMCLKYNGRYLIYGALLGILIPILIVLVLFSISDVQITEFPNRFAFIHVAAFLTGYAGLSFFTGLAEETVFRAMLVREIAVKWGWIYATLIGGIFFGLIHLISNIENMSLFDAIWIMIAGIMVSGLFVAMFIRSQSLWLPIGFHAGWNFCLVAILGTKMSGGESNFGLFSTEIKGNTLVTGGQFGMETSVISMAFYILIAVLFIKYSQKGKVELLSHEHTPTA